MSNLTSLNQLVIGGTNITSANFVSGLTNLTQLNLYNTAVSDVTPLSGLTKLTALYLQECQIADIAPLTGLTKLKTLYVASNNLDLTAGYPALGEIQAFQTGGASVSFLPQNHASTHIAGVPSGWVDHDVGLSFTATDNAGGIHALTTHYRLAGGGLQTYAPSTVVTVTAEGTTAVDFYTTYAGQIAQEPTVSAGVRMDRTPPHTTSDAVAAYSASAKIRLTATDALSGVASTRWSIDGEATQTGTSVSCSAAGPHTLAFSSVDVAGNEETASVVAFVVNPPAKQNTMLKLTGASSVALGRSYSVRGTITPAAAPGRIFLTVYRYKGGRWINYGRARVDISGGTFVYNYKPKFHGKWRIYVSYSQVTVGSVIYLKAKTVTKNFTVK